jgi:two-component system, OmpR family, phosphate regulon response regulator PhoB
VLAKGTILVAEDDPDIRYLVAFKLQRSGFAVIEAADTRTALAVASRHRPDLALLDMCPPRMDGLLVCRELRAVSGTAHLPIVIMTARSRPQDREQAYAAGATDYVVKPFSPRELVERVRAALTGARTP